MWGYQRSSHSHVYKELEIRIVAQLESLEFWFWLSYVSRLCWVGLGSFEGSDNSCGPWILLSFLVNTWIGIEQMTNGHRVGKEGVLIDCKSEKKRTGRKDKN